MGTVLKLIALLGPLAGKAKVLIPILKKAGTWVLEALENFWYKLSVIERIVFFMLALIAAFGWYMYFTKPAKVTIGGYSSPVTVTVYKNKVVVGTSTYSKPVEGTASLSPTGELAITRLGLCLVPFAGVVYADKNIEPVGGIRFFYFDRFGLAIAGNNERLLLGADMRLPYISNVGLSAGVYSKDWKIDYPYFGASFYLR